MRNRKNSIVLLFTVLFSVNLFAVDIEPEISNKDRLISAQQKLQATFNKVSVVGFKETDIPDLFEVDLGNGTIYFHSKTEWLFFGEIWDKEGKNLTIESRTASAKKNMDRLPMESALTFGDLDGIEIIEFTDPDCPYCRSYERFYNSIKSSYKIKRKIFFDTRIHPDAINKVIHVICSDNQEEEYNKIYSGIKPEVYKTCDKSEEIIANHKLVAESLGVSGTPTFILDGEVVTGFRKSKITNFLNSKK